MSGPELDREPYAEFSAKLHQKVTGTRVPINGTIEVTRRCPHECVHCYNNLSLQDHAAQRNELTLAEHGRILEEIAEAGCMWLLYTGGEIFARSDFLAIYTYAKRLGMIISLFTNGMLITPKIADYLATWRPFSIEITLYGRTQETYERVTGVAGSFNRCMTGINLLRERGLPLKLKTMVLSTNKHEIGDIRRFAEDELGVEFLFDSLITPRIDCSQNPLAVRLTPREVVECDLLSPARVAEFYKFHHQFGGLGHAVETGDELYRCGGGVNAFAINPEGRLSLCVLSQADSYDLRKGSFQEGWNQVIRQVREKKITVQTKCRTCPLHALCGMCPANGELENQHPEMPVDFLCQVAHLRAYTFDIPVDPNPACEYCPGGKRYDELMRTVEHLQHLRAAHAVFYDLTSAPRSLPVINPTSTLGGCPTCA